VAANAGRPAESAAPRSRRAWRLLVQYCFVVFAAIAMNFALPRLAPGSPVDYLAPPENGALDAQERQELLSRFDLDGSATEQFGSYLVNLGQGDLGLSVRDGRPVSDVVVGRLGWTLLLVGTAVAASTVLGIALGFAAGWRRGSRRDVVLLAGVLAVDALPAFFVGLMSVLVFSVKLGWFPVFGAVAPEQLLGWEWFADVGQRLVLPATTLTLVGIGSVFVVARSAMISELGEDYVFMARAKGLDDRGVRRHARRNALIPVSTVALLGFSTMVGAATVVETVFSYPGLGSLAFAAVRARDYPLLQGIFLLLALVAISVNLINDLLYPLLDPRVRLAGS
jgi:peptide/nickel transport system permease protein